MLKSVAHGKGPFPSLVEEQGVCIEPLYVILEKRDEKKACQNKLQNEVVELNLGIWD